MAFDPIVLIDPDGNEYTVTSAVEFNNLVFGQGYRPKDKTVEEAMGARSAKNSPKISRSSSGQTT